MAAFALLVTANKVAAADGCTKITGMIVPECNVGICNQGTFTGDLAGHFTSKVTSIYPTKSGWVFTAWTRIELGRKQGIIETLNSGSAPFDTNGGPDLSKSTEVLTITEATGTYQDYHGKAVLTGGHPLGRPTPYAGKLCKPIAHR